jgi:hypothetical protein
MSAQAMSSKKSLLGWILVGLAPFALAPTARANPPKRTQAFSRLPDWSGIWLQDAIVSNPGGDPVNIAGLNLSFGHPPYNAAWEANYQQRLKSDAVTAVKSCNMDFPVVMQSPQPFELTVTPEETLLTAGDGAIRHIYTDGRRHPAADDLTPSRMGDSIGHWQGDVLVVDTVGRRAGPVLYGEISFSEAAHFSERIRKTGRDSLEDQMTVEDPVALTKPWTVALSYGRVTFVDRILPYECDQTDRILITDGKAQIVPAGR